MKKVLALLLAALLLLTLAACSVTTVEIAGTYVGSYADGEDQYLVTIQLDVKKEYTSIYYKNGELTYTESGDFELVGSELRCYPGTDMTRSVFTAYQYADGTLTNNGHVFTKK